MIRVLVALVGLVACEREERPLQQPAAAAALPTLAPQATVVPGADPKLGDTFDFKLHGYRETAAGVDTVGAPRMLELGIGYDSQSR